MKLYLDPGHGGNDPGASGYGLLEKNINLDIASRIHTILLDNYDNINIRMSRTDDITKSLQQRTNEANAWGADYYLSIHCNAFNGNALGYEDYIHNRLSDTSPTARYRNIIHQEVTKVNQLTNRGKKKENFHVLRESNMPAFLSENGFIDHEEDAKLLSNPSWRQAVARGHANGIAKAFNLQRKTPIGPPEDPHAVYRVISGSFRSRTNAEKQSHFLTSHGFGNIVKQVTISGENWYRVQVGAYSNKNSAEDRLNQVKQTGITDAFITTT